MAGRGKDVSDNDFLSAMASIEGPFVVSSELEEILPIGQNQVNNRLNDFYSQDLVDFKEIGRGRGWWITDKGRQYLAGDFDLDDL